MVVTGWLRNLFSMCAKIIYVYGNWNNAIIVNLFKGKIQQ